MHDASNCVNYAVLLLAITLMECKHTVIMFQVLLVICFATSNHTFHCDIVNFPIYLAFNFAFNRNKMTKMRRNKTIYIKFNHKNHTIDSILQ